VNVRQEDNGESLGNQITFLPVVLPLGIDDPVKLLHAVIARMEIMKGVRAAELLGIAAAWIGAAPPPLQALFWEGLPMLPLPAPLFNMICTNIPGSSTPLYSVGRRMISSYPQVPTGYELGIGIAVQSYDGRMCFGLTADAGAAPDVERMRDFLQDCYRELCRAAGVARPRSRKPEREKPKPASKPAKARVRTAGAPADQMRPVPAEVTPAANRENAARLTETSGERDRVLLQPASVSHSADLLESAPARGGSRVP
jgi:diacylglycerol O-acyltransferase